MKSTRTRLAGLEQMFLCLLLTGLVFASSGCGPVHPWEIAIRTRGGEDAVTAAARSAAEIGNQLVITASANCPDADKEIDAALAAAKAADDAAHAIGGPRKGNYGYGGGLGLQLDQAQLDYEKADEAATKAAEELSKKKEAYDAADNKYEQADAPYVKAKEQQEAYEIQMAATVKTSTLAKLSAMPEEKVRAKLTPMSGEFDSNLVAELGTSGVPVAINWAIAKATKKALETEHQKNAVLHAQAQQAEKEWGAARTKADKAAEAKTAAKEKVDKLRAEYLKKVDEAVAKTQAARIANYNLAQKCPAAKTQLGQLDPSHSKGQDVFINTQQQHQEP